MSALCLLAACSAAPVATPGTDPGAAPSTAPSANERAAHRGPVCGLAALDGVVWSCSQAGVFAGIGGDVRFLADPGFRPFDIAVFRGPDGTWLLIGGGEPGVAGEVAVLDPRGTVRARRRVAEDVVYAVAAASESGTARAAAGCADGRVLTFRPTDLGDLAERQRHSAACRDVAFSRDGRRLVSVGLDGNLILSTVSDGGAAAEPRVVQDHTAGIECLTIGQDDVIASGARDGRIRLHAPDGTLRRTYTGLGSRVLAVCSADSDEGSGFVAGLADGRVVALSANDATCEVLDSLRSAVHSLACATAEGICAGLQDGRLLCLEPRRPVVPE